jgi:hypothetical protein
MFVWVRLLFIVLNDILEYSHHRNVSCLFNFNCVQVVIAQFQDFGEIKVQANRPPFRVVMSGDA